MARKHITVMVSASLAYDDETADENEVNENMLEAIKLHVGMVEQARKFSMASHLGPSPDGNLVHVASNALVGVL